MSKRRKNRARHHNHPSGQGTGRGPANNPDWSRVAPPPAHGVEEVPISVCDALKGTPTPPAQEDESAAESGYNRSRHNATTHGMRSDKCPPPSMAVLIDERIAALTAEVHSRTTFETWALREFARASVQVEVGFKRLLDDEPRVVEWLSGPGWESDASAAVESLAGRLGRFPYRTARELERTKQGTNVLVYHLKGLADVVRSKNGLDDIQRSLLFDVLGVPLPLRDGTRRVPAADNGPALLALIEQELARHQANLTGTLNQRDRNAQLLAINNPHAYNDKHRRGLRSDHARALKHMVWSKETLDQLRKGVSPSSIIDPRTHQPINPYADDPPARKRAAAATSPPPPPAPPSSPPPPPPSDGQAAEEALVDVDPDLIVIPDWLSPEGRESAILLIELMKQRKAEDRAAEAQAEPPPTV